MGDSLDRRRSEPPLNVPLRRRQLPSSETSYYLADADARRGRGAGFAFLQGRFGGERPGAAGVTEEHLPGPETARFPVGRSPTRPMSH